VIQLQTLGRIDVLGSDGTSREALVAQPKRMALLAFLALASARGFVRRDTLVAMFWPDLDHEHARGALSQALRFLRRELGHDAFSRRGEEEIALDLSRVTCDVAAFERAHQDGDHLHAIELYAGEFLEGLHVAQAPDVARWLDGERHRLSLLYAKSLDAMSDELSRAGDATGALVYLRRRVAQDPYNGAVAIKYMQALVAAGDRAGAIAHASEHAEGLASDLQAEPDPDVSSFAAQLRENPDRRGAPPAGVASFPDGTSAASGSVDSAASRAIAAPNSENARRHRRRPLILAGLCIAGLTLIMLSLRSRTLPDSKRVVVATFDNLTGDSTLNTLGVMAADWITDGIQRTGLLDVVPLSTMLVSLSRRDLDAGSERGMQELRDLGRATDARYVVSGTYYLTDGRLRFQPRVVDVWSRRVVGSPRPVSVARGAELQGIEQLRQAVLGTLATLVDKRVASWAEKASNPPSLAAFSEFAEGMDLFLRRNKPADAIPHFARAAAADSAYVTPILWMIRASTHQASNWGDRTDSLLQVVERSRESLTRLDALLLDRLQARRRRDPESAYRASRALVALAPGSNFAVMLAGDALATNRVREAVSVFSDLDPRQAQVFERQDYWQGYAYALHSLGDYHRELAVARQAKAMHPGVPRFVWQEAQALAGLGRERAVQQLVDCCLMPLGGKAGLTNFSGGFTRNVALELRAHGYPQQARAVLERVCSWYASVSQMEDSIPGLRYQRMQALEELERWGEARTVAETLLSRGTFVTHARRVIGKAALAAGDSARARAELSWIVANATPMENPRELRDAAELAAVLGERERAVTLLRQAFARGQQYDFWLHINTGLESLRELPAYRELTRIRD